MKTAHDPRHQKRVAIVKDLFAWQFNPNHQTEFKETNQVIESLENIDRHIKEAAPEWPISQINKIDLAILRISTFELIIDKDVPLKVIVDEAVEIAKVFGGESSPSFINGVLGKIISTSKTESK